MRTMTSLAGPLIALAIASGARAAIITNGALETTTHNNVWGMVYASPTVNSNALPGWTITGNIDITPRTYWRVGQGNYSVDLVGTPGLGAISQVMTGLIPGNEYELTFLMAINPGDGLNGETGSTKRLALTFTDANSALITPDIASSAAGSISVAKAATSIFSGVASGSLANFPYVLQTVDFQATTTTATLKFEALLPLNLPANRNIDNIRTGPVIDNVSVLDLGAAAPPPTVPEPSSLALLGIGGALLLRRRTRSPESI